MTAEDKSITQETQNKQENTGTENKKDVSDAQLLLQSKEKIQKVEGSHMNFSEASKREEGDIEKQPPSDSKSKTDSSPKNESKDDD